MGVLSTNLIQVARITKGLSRKIFELMYDFIFFKKHLIIKDYEGSELVSFVMNKSLKFTDQIQESKSIPITSLRTILPFALGKFPQEIKVLDFGGAGGQSYTEAKYFFPEIYFKWIVLETKSMVKAAKIAGLESDTLMFVENFSDVDKYKLDLVIASSSLQYTNDPIGFLAKISNLGARYMYISRAPLSNNEFASIEQVSNLSDNGPQIDDKDTLILDGKVQVLAQIVPRFIFERNIELLYSIKCRIVEGRQSFTGSGKSYDMFGYFCEAKRFQD